METNFIDELLREAEEKETQLTYEYADLILLEIKTLQSKINQVTETVKKEIQILEEWALNKSVKYQDRIEFLEKKLNQFIRNQNQKTIDLANGVIRLRKGREKLEVFDMDKVLIQQILTRACQNQRRSKTRYAEDQRLYQPKR
ncbi:MAG: host-nuclease inhibitor Gam family protein [Melioribacteraceae bacterium]|nr:host-nuclease inhibitor Gam family protein [Melioribacteraceae bacterium]